MATTSPIVFQKNENEKTWESEFVSSGPAIVEIERTDGSPLSISANIPGMNPVILYVIHSQDAIFRLDVPSGIEVSIRSWSEVKSAKMFTE